MNVISLMPHLWIIPLISLVMVGLGFLWFFVLEERFGDNFGGWEAVGIFWWCIGGLGLVLSACLLIPYDAKYFVFYRLTGTVESITNTFESGSGEITYTPVLELSGYDDPIVTNDPRLLTLEGVTVDLTCTIEWSPFGADVTHCSLAGVIR